MSDAIAISASTRLCAVFGHPIRHSASPAMQNAGPDPSALERELDGLADGIHDQASAEIKLGEGRAK